MTDKLPSERMMEANEVYKVSMEEFTKRLNEKNLERMRSTAIGGSSVSLAIVLVLNQIPIMTPALKVALYGAVLAMPALVGAWQFVESYMYHGRKSLDHFSTIKGSGVFIGLFFFGALMLMTSVTSMVAHLSVLASVLFVVSCAFVAVLVYKQGIQIKGLLQRQEET